MKFLKFSNIEGKEFLLNPSYITEVVNKGSEVSAIINFKGQEWTVNHSIDELEKMIHDALNSHSE